MIQSFISPSGSQYVSGILFSFIIMLYVLLGVNNLRFKEKEVESCFTVMDN